MTSELEAIVFATLIFMAFVFYIANRPQKNDYYEPPQPEPLTPPKVVQQTADPILALDWMLANSIIDTREYNQLVVKCLPFL